MKIYFRATILIIFSLVLLGCATARFSINDSNMFGESPYIVVRQDNYYLRFQYGKLTFLTSTESKIEGENLIFYLPVTTSTGNPTGRYQEELITNQEKIKSIKTKNVYWQEPSGELIRLNIVNDTGQLSKAHYSIERH